MVGLTVCNRATNNEALTTGNEVLVKNPFDYFNAHNWTKMETMYADTSDHKIPRLDGE